MPRKSKHTDQSFTVWPHGSLTTKRDEKQSKTYTSTKGFVETEHGYVRAYASEYVRRDTERDHHRRADTSLEFIHDGRKYRRHFRGKRYSERYIVTLAKRLVADVVDGRFGEGG